MTDFVKMENDFLEKWSEEYKDKSFLKDGVIDEEIYFKENTRVLFVLKEANWINGRDDMKKYLKDPDLSKNWWKTWNNIARWTLALLDGGEYSRYISSEHRANILRRIAFINLKKEGGDNQADAVELIEAAKEDKEYINKQIEMYRPDIIICCGKSGKSNATILRDYVLQDNISEWKRLNNSVYYYFLNQNNKQIPIVSFVHPQMRGGHKNFEKKYNIMLDIRDELINAKNK